MTVMKTAESFQATYAATSVPKTVILACLKKIKMICDRNFKNQILTACILEFVFSDCLLQETIFDNCNKLCGKYFRDTVWNGDHAMKVFTFLKRVFNDLKIIINESKNIIVR